MKIKLIFILFYLGLFCTAVWSQGLSIELSETHIDMGQQFRLTLTYNPKETQDTPDLRVLQKDFTVIATEQAMSYTVLNGQARSTAQWSVVLEPKHSGMLRIPALHIGHLTSVPQQIEVRSTHAADPIATTSMDKTNEDSTLSVSVDQNNPYLNQEVLYKVRLMTRSQLVDVRYQAPQVDDAILFPIGENQHSQTIHNGETYQVNEQIYAIFPQKSGSLSVSPPRLRALAYTSTPQHIALVGEMLSLQVQPLPKSVSRRAWLPSKLVRLRETYDQSATQFNEGATLTRTIELQAQGLVAQLLPSIEFSESQDVRIYPGQPEQDNRIQQGELWGQSKIKVTYVFAHPGAVSLPAIRVPWFNVKTQKMEVAELPAKTYEIAPATSKILKKQPTPSDPERPSKIKMVRLNTSWEIKPVALFWSVLLVTGLSMVFGLWQWRLRRVNSVRTLRAACMSNHIEHTKAALVTWGRRRWPEKNILHFTDILPLLHKQDALYVALQSLVEIVYHPAHTTQWYGKDLWQAIRRYKKKKTVKPSKRKSRSTVPPIYPTRK